MLELMLVRHGKAESPNSGMTDHSRPLAASGIKDIKRQGNAFPCLSYDHVLVSDAVRTRETFALLTEAWGVVPPHHITGTGYLAEASTWLNLIPMTEPDARRLWVIGHNPGISDLVFRLTHTYVGMATSDIVHIVLKVDDWTAISDGAGRLLGHYPGGNA